DMLQQLECRPDVSQAEIHREHRLDTRHPTPGEELVSPELVGLDAPPGEVEPPWPGLPGADAVAPVVARDEVAARVPDQGHAELADELQDVRPEPLGRRTRVLGLVQTAVDAAPEVFDERTEEPGIGPSDHAVERDHGLARCEVPTGWE